MWVNAGMTTDRFDAINPFSAVAEIYARRGWRNPFTILLFDGYNQLTPDYRAKLGEWGYALVDYSAETERLYAQFPALMRYPINERICFLRWLAVEDWVKDQGISEQVFVIDADIVFNVDPALVAQEFKGVTTTMQGNPCFTSISDYGWFTRYRQALVALNADVEGYSKAAWDFKRQTPGALTQEHYEWFGDFRREIISSDMDLIGYLLLSGQLPQTPIGAFFKGLKYYYAENAMLLGTYAKKQVGRAKGVRFVCRDGEAQIDGKKLAFWHFQGEMRTWLNLVFLLRKLGWRGRVPMHHYNKFARWFAFANHFVLHMSRRDVIHGIRDFGFADTAFQLGLEEIFCDQTYWDEGVFCDLD